MTGPAATLTTAPTPEAGWAIQAVRGTADGSHRQSCHSYAPGIHPLNGSLRARNQFTSALAKSQHNFRNQGRSQALT